MAVEDVDDLPVIASEDVDYVFLRAEVIKVTFIGSQGPKRREVVATARVRRTQIESRNDETNIEVRIRLAAGRFHRAVKQGIGS